MISIGIPFYNASDYLEDAIKSVILQSFSIWELILIDDGSTDNSLEIALKYASLDCRIRVISDGENKKLPYRLNQIISEAKFKYIARMDADDLMDVDRLEKQFNILEAHPEYDLVTTSMFSIGRNNEVLGKRILVNRQMQAPEILKGLTNLLHASLLARKEWCERNLYAVENSLAEDYELWLTSALKNDLKYYVIEEPLYYYREFENVKKDKMIKGYNTQISIIRKYSSGVISGFSKNKIIFKFNVKKIIVYILNYLNMMFILQNNRVVDVTPQDLEKFERSMLIIENYKS